MSNFKRQIIVIGGGASGLSLTRKLARLGYGVTLVEKAKVGGDCLYYGCVPSKAFIECAKMAFNANNAKKYGINCDVNVDFAQVQAYTRSVVAQIEKYDSPNRFKSHGVDIIHGNAHFVGDHMISVDDKLIPAEKFIIATGSKPKIPKIPGLTEIAYYTYETMLSINKQPNKLLIIGAGTVGLEYAQAFARLGTKVTVLEANAELMPAFDQAQINILKEQMLQEGIEFLTNVKIMGVTQVEGTISVEFQPNGKDLPRSEHLPVTGDALLLAAGREPQLDNLDLDLLGIDYSDDGIVVDEYLKTTKEHVFAIGDVIQSPYKFSHLSEYHAGIIVANLAFKLNKKVSHRLVPSVIYTDPEFAQVGLTQKAATAKGLSYKVIEYPLKKVDRAIIAGQVEGSIKLLVRRNKLIGASILSPHAGELINELTLAIAHKIPLKDINKAMHPYPTWSQMHSRAINKHYEPKLFGSFSKMYIRFRQLFE